MSQYVIASWVPALGPTLMDETNTAVIARLDRATQYSRDACVQPRSRGLLDRPVKPREDSLVVAGVLPRPFFLGAKRRSNPVFFFPFLLRQWIASLRSQ
jgi:hypothetical protein